MGPEESVRLNALAKVSLDDLELACWFTDRELSGVANCLQQTEEVHSGIEDRDDNALFSKFYSPIPTSVLKTLFRVTVAPDVVRTDEVRMFVLVAGNRGEVVERATRKEQRSGNRSDRCVSCVDRE
jgi:hypothetical protein